ncbi:MAG TPA: histidinol-phosphate transaminase [Tepidiformaceae bacterium]|nr:histidinol-phosphate transaminase [Tepidiformaceae bacterium]
MDIRRLLRADIDELEEYTPVKPLEVLAAEIGVPVERLVKLDANENLYGAPEAVFTAIAGADLHIYPDPSQTALRKAIASFAGVSPEQVVAGTGADDLIDILLRLTLPEAVVIPTPAFGMYSFLARISQAKPIEVPRGPGFELDVAAVRAAVEESGAKVVFVTSPNNPTGNPLSRAEVEELCALEALIVVDEAYIEFGGETAVPLIAGHPNLVVLRTFSKWAGLAGLRVGYAIATPELAREMMAIKQPYNVSVAADVGARAAIEHRGEVFETVRCIVAERERMSQRLAAFDWLEPLPSAANFVLVRVLGREARSVRDGLRKRGVLIRYYDRPDLANYIRISTGRPEDTDRLIEALHSLEDE